ncbi:MAG: hypothetical protein IJX85_09470 [Lachnospiraceae bacterium]|nr:hypothetical protein [Lachnospiraceae bacterium]
MNKIKKLFKKLDNRGSSILLVIVALTFLGVIVGALLTAAGYSYRLKMQDLNSRDNFYYVEQAMNEIYAGVGSQTVKDMQEAYTYTVENMVRYDFITNSYITLDDDEVQKMFTDRFMNNVQANSFFSGSNTDLANALEKYISNDSVKLDKSRVSVEKVLTNGKVTKIVIKNVTLTRTVEYDRNVANGSYTQTISTDIEIGEPNFAVLFNSTNQEYANIFDYSMVADMGIEVIQPTTPLVVTGNVYAAADYYNKKYNESRYVVNDKDELIVKDSDKKYNSGLTYEVEDKEGNKTSESIDVYTHGSVTSKKYAKSAAYNTMYNAAYDDGDLATGQTGKFKADYMFDGVNDNSMYSGIYVDGSSLSIVGDMVIVPGTVAVLDNGSFSLYGKSGRNTSEAELWADNIILGGQSIKKEELTTEGDTVNVYDGSSMVLYANTYIKDDTELNANGSEFKLRGNYFGYGDSTEKDERVFMPTVDKENFQFSYVKGQGENAETVWENRGHYNSSAIIINGQKSTLDLANADVIYLAGRSYIELSGKHAFTEEEVTTTANSNGTTTEDKHTVISETYTYLPKGGDPLDPEDDDVDHDEEEGTVFLRDYKTGESISMKTSQLAYIPVMYSGIPTPVYTDAAKKNFAGYFEAELHVKLQGGYLFDKYFPETVFKDYKIPCVMQEISGKKYYYYDFETAYNMMLEAVGESGAANFKDLYPSAQYYASAFIVDYDAEIKKNEQLKQSSNTEIELYTDYLVDIFDFEEHNFEPGDIILPKKQEPTDLNPYPITPNAFIYSSGAITTKENTQFTIKKSDKWTNAELEKLFSSEPGYNFSFDVYANGNGLTTSEMQADSSLYPQAYLLSDDLEIEYDLVKWNLGHYETTGPDALKNATEIEYIQKMVDDVNYGDASITPINKFLNVDKIVDDTSIIPNLSGSDNGPKVLDLSSGYSVWVSYGDVEIKARDKDQGAVRGLVVTKGDVKFNSNVTSFEGLIISGGKVYITENLATMNANAAICQTILNECQLLGTSNAELVLSLFKGYEVDNTNKPVASPGDANASNQAKTIDNIDYSDVCRFNNWMKNVE